MAAARLRQADVVIQQAGLQVERGRARERAQAARRGLKRCRAVGTDRTPRRCRRRCWS